MAVFLLILKIIGITLLVILGILVLLILVLLFVPVRYKVDAFIPEDDIKATNGTAYIRYMHLLRVWLSYTDNEFNYKLKSLCFNINLDKDKLKDSHKEKPIKENSVTEAPIKEKSIKEETIKEEPIKEEPIKEQSVTEKTESTKSKKKRKKKKLKKSKKSKITDKFKKIWNDIKFYYRMLKDEHNKAAFNHCMKYLKKLLKHYMPRKAVGFVNFGLTDPSNTGLITGFLSLFPFMYTGKFRVYPDFCFDKNYINGEIHIKGHMRFVHLLNAFILVYFNRDVKRFIKLMKKHKHKEE